MHETKALVINSFDDHPHLANIPVPVLGPTQVLVVVRAASVNAYDWKVAYGAFRNTFTYRFPVTIGRDFAGTVSAIGDAVTRVSVGDEVFGYLSGQELQRGSYAGHLWLDQSEAFVAKPVAIDHVAAACLPLSGVVALRSVEALQLAARDVVLVVGAPGGVGSYVVQLAVSRGAHVLATGQPDDDEYLRQLGAAEVVRPGVELIGEVRGRYPTGIAGLVDLVHNRDDFEAHLELLMPAGRAVSVHRSADEAAMAARGLVGVNVGSAPDVELLARLGDLAAHGQLRVPLQGTYPLEHAAEALATLKAGHARGKLAVVMDGVAG